ncbi:MAG: right-handed parallel beta-helix repeat-containing protein [Ignavibacteriales bacterium]|nr:right-handed parallel beta-helix repeat-containing protein [Ignavibacteriales bacterium]
MKKLSLYIVINLMMLSSIAFAGSYIVAESNGDFNSIQSALQAAVAGDTILVREKSEPYYEKITFPNNGDQTNGYIVLMNYPNENPIIDGANYQAGNDDPQGLVRIVNKNYIKIIGFEIRNIVVSNNSIFPAGIWVYGSSSNIEITKNKIHTIQQTANNAGSHGLAVYGTHPTNPISNILIDGNEIYNCKLGWSESLVLNGNVDNFVVKNNSVHDNNNIAYDFIGHEKVCPTPALDQARNGIVFNNIAYNIDSRGNQAYGDEASADGFYVDGGKDIIIERNTVYNCNIGIEIASEHGGKSTSGIIVRNNLVRENIVLGIAFGGYDSKRGSTDNCKIINNTLYKNNTENFDWGAEILVQYYCENNLVANNIVYSNSNIPMVDNSTKTGSDNLFSNNLYYTEGTAKWNWKSNTYTDFDSYKSNSSQEENSLFGDPLLVDPTLDNPAIQQGSNAVDNGNIFSENLNGDLDYFGNNRINNDFIDIGAAESSDVTGIESFGQIMKNDFELKPAFPNPFNPTTTIKFKISPNSFKRYFELNIYDILGRNVKSETFNSNVDEITYKWNAENMNSGVYYAVVSSDNEFMTNKLILLK